MRPVLSRQQMQSTDQRTIRELGLPSRLLMENAGKACAERITDIFRLDSHSSVVILCGTGNNGGDGFVIARHLQDTCGSLLIVALDNANRSKDNRLNLELCLRLNIPVLFIKTLADIDLLEQNTPGFVLVDALYGTGFHGRLDPLCLQLINVLQERAASVVAIDIPSGLDADNGLGPDAVKADATLILEAPVYGNILGEACEHCGELSIIRIGIPASYISEASDLLWCNAKDLSLPQRLPRAHKGTYGRVAILAGSPGLAGAACLASKAALRAGAGYVHLFHPSNLKGAYHNCAPEILCRAVDFDLPEADHTHLDKVLQQAKAILIGPGIGNSSSSQRMLEYVLKRSAVPTILDGDALNLMAKSDDLKQLCRGRAILLTPHWGEFCRLAGLDLSTLLSDPVRHLREYCQNTGFTVLLKSHYSLIADAESTYLCTSGNDGLATGGSGDVLAGIATAFVAQGMELLSAAVNASLLLGLTAEKISKYRNKLSLLPSDIVENILVFPDFEQEKE